MMLAVIKMVSYEISSRLTIRHIWPKFAVWAFYITECGKFVLAELERVCFRTFVSRIFRFSYLNEPNDYVKL